MSSYTIADVIVYYQKQIETRAAKLEYDIPDWQEYDKRLKYFLKTGNELKFYRFLMYFNNHVALIYDEKFNPVET